MIRITKCKTIGDPGPLPTEEKDIFVYRVLDGDKILGTQAIDANTPALTGETLVKKVLGSFILRDLDIEEITELEDKELVSKNELNNITQDFE